MTRCSGGTARSEMIIERRRPGFFWGIFAICPGLRF
jgi:hypothetical protein